MRRNCLLFTALLACSVAALAAENPADQRCPKLPAASGFVWQYSRGPDFDVCHAENKDAANEASLEKLLKLAESLSFAGVK